MPNSARIVSRARHDLANANEQLRLVRLALERPTVEVQRTSDLCNALSRRHRAAREAGDRDLAQRMLEQEHSAHQELRVQLVTYNLLNSERSRLEQRIAQLRVKVTS